jgi:hypothetical protein
MAWDRGLIDVVKGLVPMLSVGLGIGWRFGSYFLLNWKVLTGLGFDFPVKLRSYWYGVYFYSLLRPISLNIESIFQGCGLSIY